MEKQEFEFTISGKDLKGYRYKCENPRVLVVLLHGMGEYAIRHERSVIPALLKASVDVFSYDQFGHGKSSEKKGHHPGFDLLLDAVDHVVELASTTASGIPVILYGHSMGGNVAANYALKRPGKIDGLILTSPFLRLAFKPPSWKLALGRALLKIAPGITMGNELDTAALSKDPAEIEAYKKDPLVHDRVSPAYSVELIKTGEWAIQQASSLKVPTLVIHGAADRITSHLASKEFAEAAGEKAVYIEVPEGYHELHHDQEKKETMNKIIEWIYNKQ